MKILTILLTLYSFVSCDFNSSREKTIDVSAASGSDDQGSGGNGGSTDNGGGVQCSGDESDGHIDNQDYPSPLFNMSFSAANNARPWSPGEEPLYNSTDERYDEVLHEFRNIDLAEAFARFENTGPYFIRIRLNPQPNEAYQGQRCWKRENGATVQGIEYQEAEFIIRKFGIIKEKDANGQVKHRRSGPSVLVARYTVKADRCGEIIPVHPIITPQGVEANNFVTAVEITQVQTDYSCQVVTNDEALKGQTSHYCPFNTTPKSICVDGVLQISTNHTQFFKGYKRSDFFGN